MRILAFNGIICSPDGKTMRIVNFFKKNEQNIGVFTEEGCINFTRAFSLYQEMGKGKSDTLYCGVREALYDGILDIKNISSVIQFLRKHNLVSCFLEKDPKLLPPLIPGKIIALGWNYMAHAKEGKVSPPSEPVYFEKSVSAIIGPEEAVKIPPGIGRVDPEVELAVVIGKKTRKVQKEDAYKHIFGYTILNDVTAREMQKRDIENRLPWFRSKSIDTFCPLGPWIIPRQEIEDPMNLKLWMRVNGEIRQFSSTEKMIFDIPTIISTISSIITLNPGDIISTGTPEGIQPVYPGDIMEAEVEKIGILKNTVVQGDK